MQGNTGPPIQSSRSLDGNGDPFQWFLNEFSDSEEIFSESYEGQDNVPLGQHSSIHTLPSQLPNPYETPKAYHHMCVFPPSANTVYPEYLHVPQYDVPISPVTASTPTMSPMSINTSMSSPMGTVPSPISPQPSPVPVVEPVVVKTSPRVKMEATDNDQWEDYRNPNRTYYSLCDSRHQPIPPKTISLRSRITADNLEYNPIDNAYVMYRQNQFQIEIDFVGGLANYSSSSSEPYYLLQETLHGNNYLRAEGLYFYMYSVKHQRNQPFDPEMVEITQSCGSRNAKETQTPGLSSISNGRALYNKLQFRAATQYNARSSKAPSQPNPQQQFYRIVIVLVAKVETGLEFINSRISPCLVVRGQNPGRFKDTQQAAVVAAPAPVPPMPVAEVLVNPPVLAAPPPPQPQPQPPIRSPSPALSPAPSPIPVRQQRKNARVIVKAEKHTNKRQRASIESDDDDYEVRENITPGWTKGSTPSSICIQKGKVGINTTAPQEALHVQGNIVCSGIVYKPSDERIKTNIQAVSAASQLENIKQLKIYDYELLHGREPGATMDKERGVLAQELKQILPNATRTLKDVTLADGQVMEELIVVEERALLLENIGATQELSDIVLKDQEKLDKIGKKLNDESAASQNTLNVAGKLIEHILTEKQQTANTDKNNAVCCLMVTHTNKGFYGSIFGLGPAWTLFLAGTFFPFLWFFGGLFVFSHNRKRKISGFFHLAAFVLWVVLVAVLEKFVYLSVAMICHATLGSVCSLAAGLRWNYRRKLRLLRLANKQRKAELGLATVRPEYILQVKEPVRSSASSTVSPSFTPLSTSSLSSPSSSSSILSAISSPFSSPYMSIPMEALPTLDPASITSTPSSTPTLSRNNKPRISEAMVEAAVASVNASPLSKAMARAKERISFSGERWEKNALLQENADALV